MIQSMTGFATRSFSFKEETYKIELKSLNHRFLDLKLRLPRGFTAFEAGIKTAVEAKFKRGSVEVWIERQSVVKSENTLRINDDQASLAFQVLNDLRTRFLLPEAVSLRDLLSFPDVIEKTVSLELNPDEAKELSSQVLKTLALALEDLEQMRANEGAKLQVALLDIIAQFRKAHSEFMGMREQIQARASTKIKKRVEQCFEAYSTPDEKLRALMETRIAQEISYTLEKLDIEEELTRYKGHIDLLEALLREGGLVGKKLDFMFQELNREINTLGNKSQDLGISQEVIRLKTWIEQMREQSLNLE